MTYKVAILGAGAIGCFVGAAWGGAIGSMTLVGRPALKQALDGRPLSIDGALPVSVDVRTDALALAQADVIVLTMKSRGLKAAMDQISEHVSKGAVLISLLNGTAPVRDLRARFPDRDVIAGMVPFNVVWADDTQLHQSGSGQIALERHPMTTWLADLGLPVDLHADLGPIQHGKLLLNLANAVNALSGKPLYDMLSDRAYRRVYAASIEEALKVYEAGNVPWVQVGPNNPRLALRMLRAPNWLFHLVVLRRQKLDRTSMTSMAGDLMAGRPTEIETINGEITRLGAQHGVATPVNDSLIRLVKAGQTMSADALMAEVGL